MQQRNKRVVTRYNEKVGPELSSGLNVLTIFVAAVILICVFFACNAEPGGSLNTDGTGTDSTDINGTGTDQSDSGGMNTDSDGADTDTDPPDDGFVTVTVNNSESRRGYLILVNYDHEYSFSGEDIVDLYGNENKSSSYGLANSSISCDSSILPYLNAMIDDYYTATGDAGTVINSGHRTYEEQETLLNARIESVGEEEAYAYVSIPGYSEHHTGYALDITSLSEERNVSWLPENCVRYGFILRYPADKIEMTHIAYESWHYRYVGEPHAEIITALGLAMEEYITQITEYTYDNPYYYPNVESPEYMIYRVAIDEDSASEVTELKLPDLNMDGEADENTVSGDNSGGFIVTVKLNKESE